MFGMDRLMLSVLDDLIEEIVALRGEKEKAPAPKRPNLKCKVVVYNFEPEDRRPDYIQAKPDKEQESAIRDAVRKAKDEKPVLEVPATEPDSFLASPAFGMFMAARDQDDDVCIQIGPQTFYMHKEDARTLYAKISQELRRAKKAERDQTQKV